MKKSSFFDLDKCCLSNNLWSSLINKIGIFKANLAARQALDLQRMQGNPLTLPVLILDTCGTALISSKIVKTHVGLSYVEHGMLLIYSNKSKAIQLLREN